MTAWRLVADVGGSNARFARVGADGALTAARAYPVDRFASFARALAAYLDESGGRTGCAGAAIAGAGPLIDGAIALTNAPWRLEPGAVRTLVGDVPVRLMNDLAAVAHAVPHLGPEALAPVGEAVPAPHPEAARLVVNVGTGLGAAALLATPAGPVAAPSEPGHMTLAPADAAERDIFACADPPLVQVEDALSGDGLVRLWRAAGGAAAGTPPTARAVLDRAGDDAAAGEAVRLFTVLLGRVAGDLVLAHAAWGGVYLCGSVARAWRTAGDAALFRAHLTAKGKMSEVMASVPAFCILVDEPALSGLAHVS